MLSATGDHDRVFGGRHRSRPGHPADNGPPQPDLPRLVAVQRLFGTDSRADLAAPLRSREQRGVRETRTEIESAAVRWRSEVRRPACEPGAKPEGGRGG